MFVKQDLSTLLKGFINDTATISHDTVLSVDKLSFVICKERRRGESVRYKATLTDTHIFLVVCEATQHV